jgi:ribosomal protein L7/L12
MKELLTEDEFHRGYQEGLKTESEALKMLRDALKISLSTMANKKVESIKKLREETGLTLKEAKDQIEEWMDKLPTGLI